jgi:hypothetical protein
MNESQAELTTVISHLPDGRIHQFVKTPIRLAEAEQMRVKALLAAEEFKAKALLENTNAILEKAQTLAPSEQKPAPAARPVPQQRGERVSIDTASATRAAPIASPDDDAVVPVRDAVVPARVVAEAKRKKAQLAAERKKQAEVVAEAKALISAKTKEAATISGKAVGRAVMKDLIDRIPPGHMAANVDKSLDEIMGRTLQQLRDQKWYPTVSWPEFGETFEKAFWVAANEAVTEFNTKPKSQPADAGATQTSV